MAEFVYQISTLGLNHVLSNGASAPFSGGSLMRQIQTAGNAFQFGGDFLGRVYGTIREKQGSSEVPVARLVRLYRDQDGLLMRAAWSKTDGTYAFDRLHSKDTYTVISYDYTGNMRAVAADRVGPEVAA